MSENRKLDFDDAANIIKDAIMRSRYRAAKLVNKELLCLYYAVGQYVSDNSRVVSWGKGAIRKLSDSLQKELPGLRGFSDGSIKKMRLFYEEWSVVFSNRSLTTNDLSEINPFFDRAVNLNLLAQHMGEFDMPGFSALDEFIKLEDENPSIGILLCKEANRGIVEFAVRDYTKPMGVATYKTRNEMPEAWQDALPDFNDMKKLLETTDESEADE